MTRDLADDEIRRLQLALSASQARCRELVEGVSVRGGRPCFEQLLRNLADATGAQAAFVTRLLPGDPVRTRCVAALVDGKPLASFDCLLAHTPGSALRAAVSLSLPEAVQTLYPEATVLCGLGAQAYVGHRLENSQGEWVGVLELVFREPLQPGPLALLLPTLQLFAVRAAAELERVHLAAQLSQLQATLEDRVQQRTAELNQANQELEAFCYSVSHDLRSPLGAIDGFASLLALSLESLPTEERDKSGHFLQRIRTGVVQMGELIDALLSLALLARQPLQREPVDLSSLAAEVLQSWHEQAPSRVLESFIEPGLWATGDRRLLRQVLDNLLGNAWKFSADQAITRISLRAEVAADGQPVYVVRDNGAGFDMAHAEKLFGPFQRLHSASQFEGSGIGLATVQRIVVRHGGRIWGESVVGQGATFRFTLGALTA